MKKSVIPLAVLFVLVLSVVPIVSAGVGLKWSQETALVPEHSNVCLTYGVYNPWPTTSYIKIQLSDSLKNITTSTTSNQVDKIPAYTYSNSTIPVKFCFETPTVYKENCLLFGALLCSQNCSQPMKEYSGQVEVHEVSSSNLSSGGSGGSATAMSVSAPLKVKVQCIAHGTDYSIVYLVVGIIALIILLWKISKRKKKGSKVNKKK